MGRAAPDLAPSEQKTDCLLSDNRLFPVNLFAERAFFSGTHLEPHSPLRSSGPLGTANPGNTSDPERARGHPRPPTQIDVLTVAKRGVRFRRRPNGGDFTCRLATPRIIHAAPRNVFAWLVLASRSPTASFFSTLPFIGRVSQSRWRQRIMLSSRGKSSGDTRRKKRLDHASRLIPAPRAF
jgi:hypothetical protein